LHRHEAGVTAIAPHPRREHWIATGSYDEHARLWDRRNLNRPLASYRVPDAGIWRIRWHPELDHRMAVACMYQGFELADWNSEDITRGAECVVRYEGHQSIAYGLDYLGSTGWMATCSFYDRSFQIWSI
jgi:diphthamide biosynthesis protein 7